MVSQRLESLAKNHNLELLYIQPGKPARMRTLNVSNPTCREEVIDAYLFDGLEEIFLITEGWLEEYDTIRPHEALQGISPRQFAILHA